MTKRLHTVVPLLLMIIVVANPLSAEDQKPLDLVIKGGRIVDGSGAPWYFGDVGIDDGKIVRIGNIPQQDASEVIDANGLVVAPGFIDMMGQTASPMVENPKTAINLLTQGITTINAGEGGSAAPLSDDDGLRYGYTTMAEYFSLIESHGLPVNVVQTIGHTQVRKMVLGDVERRPSDEELHQMQDLVREAMEAGAIGVSTALIYPPAIYAQTREIAALAQVAGEYGGRYYTHMRNEGDQLLEAIDEALQIGREGNTPVHIFHLKAAGQHNWGKMQLAIARIKAARAAGHQVTADIYPYINNGLGIAALIHPRHFSQGRDQLLAKLNDPDLRAEIRAEMETTQGWENWFRHAGKDWNRIVIGRSNDPKYAQHDGESVATIATACQEDPWDTFFSLVRSGAFALPQTMSDANKILAMQQEFVSFCTDVGPAGGDRAASHPRAYGAFPRMLSRYVRDLGAISLERAVSQASAAAANDILAYDRGRIAVGLAADVIVFDYENIVDRADFRSPHAVSEGMKHVIVNGRLVLKNGEMTDATPGRVLRGPGYREEIAPYNLASGDGDPQFVNYDRSMKEFLAEHRVPGASIAVTHHGKVVFARGYGYADIAKREQVEPESLFRIASISKPITAVAILQLVEHGKLKLEDKVFDVLDYEDAIAKADHFEPRLRDITIEHLLQHRGGWDRDQSFDAMFQSVRFAEQVGVAPPADQTTVITAMLSQKLDFDPGERYAYSNLGYCMLGQVIETLTGQKYEDYVKEHVLAPIGVTDMRIGKTHLEGRAENEVRYYHSGTGESVFAGSVNERVPHPYGAWYLEAMDSHGGWLATATDLAKFAMAFDDPDHCPLLKRSSIEKMYARPEGRAGHEEDGSEKARYYSLGWSNRNIGDNRVNHWHGGSLPGTSTIMIRRHDGKNFVALLNCRQSPTPHSVSGAMDQLLHKMANEVKQWPK
ncbi:serine hydrolase [Stieleria varia]|uniref:N-acyl-D-glutamate deacylase n=1 Tax=Stieleria varia TaxID=2528005 RepID=A0A5C5ZRM3_9BACT|nr:serine hydrolase [Stieleria varia]TWT89441.1 N-acyl-D-glutamate deacylase [Stieleria varia]